MYISCYYWPWKIEKVYFKKVCISVRYFSNKSRKYGSRLMQRMVLHQAAFIG